MSRDVTRETPVGFAVDYIMRNLRVRDSREIFALRWNDNVDSLVRDAHGLCQDPASLWSVWRFRGEPVAMNGANLVRPGVCVLGAWGTDKWPYIVRALTEDAFDRVLPGMLAMGAHRAEAYALAENTDSRRWIMGLGGEQEGLLRGYGRAGEDFVVFGWRLRDVHGWRRRRAGSDALHPGANQRAPGDAGGGRPGDTPELRGPGDHHDHGLATRGAAAIIQPATDAAETDL